MADVPSGVAVIVSRHSYAQLKNAQPPTGLSGRGAVTLFVNRLHFFDCLDTIRSHICKQTYPIHVHTCTCAHDATYIRIHTLMHIGAPAAAVYRAYRP